MGDIKSLQLQLAEAEEKIRKIREIPDKWHSEINDTTFRYGKDELTFRLFTRMLRQDINDIVGEEVAPEKLHWVTYYHPTMTLSDGFYRAICACGFDYKGRSESDMVTGANGHLRMCKESDGVVHSPTGDSRQTE